MKNLFKFTLAVAVVAMVATSANATKTSTLTMGDNNNILVDVANIWIFPSRINMYPNLAIAEIESGSFSYSPGFNRAAGGFSDDGYIGEFGVHWKFGEENPWVLGTYFYTSDLFLDYGTSILPTYYPPNRNFSSGFTPLPNQRVTLFYGRQLGNLYFGATINHAHSSATIESPNDNRENKLTVFEIALGLTDQAMTWDVAAAVRLTPWSLVAADGTDIVEPDGNIAFGVTGRYFLSFGPQWTLVPNLTVAQSTQGEKDPNNNDAGVKYTWLDVMPAVGWHWTPATNVLAVMNFGVHYNQEKREATASDGTTTEDKTTTFALPFFKMGFEADIFKWLDIRLGATSYWNSESNEDNDGDKVNFAFSENETYLGFGLHFGRLHADLYTDPGLFINGFDFITGEDTDGGMNARVSVLYEMF